MKGKGSIKTGAAGVFRIMSELILRGYSPYLPGADDHGVDIMLSDGTRIQVKTAHLSDEKRSYKYRGEVQISPSRLYHFNFGTRSGYRKNLPITTLRREKRCSEEIDFMILFGIEESRFWVIPSFLLDGSMGVVLKGQLELGPAPLPSREKVRELAAQGKGLEEIATELGVCPVTVWNYKNKDGQRGSFIRSVRMCENRWDFLASPPTSRDDALARIESAIKDVQVEQLESML